MEKTGRFLNFAAAPALIALADAKLEQKDPALQGVWKALYGKASVIRAALTEALFGLVFAGKLTLGHLVWLFGPESKPVRFYRELTNMMSVLGVIFDPKQDRCNAAFQATILAKWREYEMRGGGILKQASLIFALHDGSVADRVGQWVEHFEFDENFFEDQPASSPDSEKKSTLRPIPTPSGPADVPSQASTSGPAASVADPSEEDDGSVQILDEDLVAMDSPTIGLGMQAPVFDKPTTNESVTVMVTSDVPPVSSNGNGGIPPGRQLSADELTEIGLLRGMVIIKRRAGKKVFSMKAEQNLSDYLATLSEHIDVPSFETVMTEAFTQIIPPQEPSAPKEALPASRKR